MIDPEILTTPARRIQTILTCVGLLLLVVTAVFAVNFMTTPAGLGESLARMGGFETGPLQPWQSGCLVAIAGLHLAIWIMLIHRAHRVFGNLARGEPEPAGRAARTLARWLWVLLAWGFISQILASLVATWHFPQGEHAISLSLGTSQISIVLLALIAGFMAHAFAIGAELWRDHQEVV